MAEAPSDQPGLSEQNKRAGHVRTLGTRRPYQNYFSVVEHDISIPKFDGGFSQVVTRAAFVSGDAVAVLPYDPVRDRVLVIEQFRFGPHIRGDAAPWKIEAIAGRIDAGETPEQTVHREMAEETGLKLQKLVPLASFYPAPGAAAEFMYAYIGLADLPDTAAGIGGLPQEAEDIKSHVLSYDKALAMLDAGQVDTGPLLTCLLWLAMRRAAIRADA